MRFSRKILIATGVCLFIAQAFASSAGAVGSHRAVSVHRRAAPKTKIVRKPAIKKNFTKPIAQLCDSAQVFQHWPEGDACWPFIFNIGSVSDNPILPAFRLGSAALLPVGARARIHVDSTYAGPLNIKVTQIIGDHVVARSTDVVAITSPLSNGVGDAEFQLSENGVKYFFELEVPEGTVVPAGSKMVYKIYRIS